MWGNKAHGERECVRMACLSLLVGKEGYGSPCGIAHTVQCTSAFRYGQELQGAGPPPQGLL